ncbi:MAG: DUF1223 domain-containing protein [Rhodobacteraceae bacterium]|jgi:hypothetical protein|uniref:DUF1223 domain-containing protein n=1 Tax=Salipiger TaxID=263377 RepID=UPI000301409F|nr:MULTISPECIES: DUF1223 domain-containing protein [Salipiger]MAB07389.1 DUF1223 domain-containing protein [Paracoccaceae bacterium]SFB88022.1 hypothetical protein SAMN05444415_101271 [Salipiger profundus]
MRRLTHWFAAVCLTMAGTTAQAQDNPVVVELFTSQGCSSCPPADSVLAELGTHDDVIPLALHVDYWDYIGWPDSFADPAFTKRQKGYARASGRRSIYTPQMVIDGRYDVVGSRPMKVVDAIRHAEKKPVVAHLSLSRADDELHIEAEPVGPFSEATVHLVRYTPQKRVEILDGENAGQTVTYSHIAHGWEVLGVWNGKAPLEMRVPISGDDPVVVMLQEDGYGPILAAARLR